MLALYILAALLTAPDLRLSAPHTATLAAAESGGLTLTLARAGAVALAVEVAP